MKNVGRILSAFALVLVTGTASAEIVQKRGGGIGTYSDGYRMGVLTKCSVKGPLIGIKSTECRLYLGNDSSDIESGEGSNKVSNPWYFSADSDSIGILEKYDAKPVWIKYDQAQVKSWAYETEYTALEIEPVTKTEPKTEACLAVSQVDEDSIPSKYSKGSNSGRIVKVSRKGTAIKTWEVIFQENNAGNSFTTFSIIDPNVYQCAIDFLKSGLIVTVRYNQEYVNFRFEDSDHTIHKIIPVPKD